MSVLRVRGPALPDSETVDLYADATGGPSSPLPWPSWSPKAGCRPGW